MKYIKARSIRTNLVLLVLLVLVPLFAILVYSSYEQKKQAIDFVKQNVYRVVNNLSIQQQFVENNIHQTLGIISELPEFQSSDPEKISSILKFLMKQNPSYAALLLVDNKGDLISSGLGISKLNVSDRKYFKDILLHKSFSVGEYTRGRLTNKPVLHFAYPVLNEDSSLRSVLIASFDLKYYDTVFKTSNLGNNAIFTFVDHNGTILYNSPNSVLKIGIKEQSGLLQHLNSNQTPYTFISKGNDGIERIYGACSLLLPDGKAYMTIYVGVPLKLTVAKFYKTLTKYAFFWVITGILIILFAYMFSVRAIVKPIDKLVKAADNIAEGNLTPQTSLTGSSSEIGKLFKAITEMTLKIQQRETEKNMALKDLKKLKERFELAVNSAKIGIFDWHIRNNKLIWDKNMFSLYGINSNDFTHQIENWKEYIHSNDIVQFNSMIDTAINEIQPFNCEIRIKLSNKSVKSIQIFGDVILDKELKPVRLIGVNWDITERKSLERKLNEAREKAETSDKLKSAFLANISHEIRTPLHGIIGFAQILKNDEISFQEKMQYLDIIIQNGNNLQNIISNIIDISLLDANQLKLTEKETNLETLFNELYNQFIHQKIEENKSFNFILEELTIKPKNLVIDDFRLKQIFSNLIDNAFKFTEIGEVRFGCNLENNQLVFYVKDTGIGIKKENAETIFDRFKQVDDGFNRNYSGNGLGLTICRGLVELMGGKIWLDRKTKGCEFYFSIPLKKEESISATLISGKTDFSLN